MALCKRPEKEPLVARLDVEHFVGPAPWSSTVPMVQRRQVRLGHSQERGRGLFCTEDVEKGRREAQNSWGSYEFI